MSRFRVPMTAVLIVFLLVDILVGYRIWDTGWPKHVSFASTREGFGQVQVVPIAFTSTDWLIVIVTIAVQALLVRMVWKAWRSGHSQQ